MKYKIADLIDIEKNQRLLDSFCDAVGIAAAIIDMEGTVLVGSRWQTICTGFHRANAGTCAKCIESDTVLANELVKGKNLSLYSCRNGLTDAASPIIIEGEHVANAFIGQFLLGPPDTDFFRRQASEYGFEQSAYMEALSRVPIVREESLPSILAFLSSFAEMVAGMGLKQLRQLETEDELRKAQEVLETRVQERTAELEKINEELRMSEEHFRRTFDEGPVGAAIVSLDYRFQRVNKALCTITGYSEEELLSLSFPDITHPEDLKADIDLIESLAAGEIDQYQMEKRYIRKDGRVVWVHLSVRIMRDAAGKEPFYFLPMMEDITERKEAEGALRAYAARLEALNSELREFAFVASHDLQEPLRKIQAFSTRLRSKCGCALSDDGLDYLVRMESAANRMQMLLASLLQYSRVAASANHFKETDLTAVANGVLGDLEDAVKRAEARVEIGDLPVIQADADQMHRLFQNLIGNGLKYRRDMEKPIVKVWSTIEGKYCKIFIEDNGIGFEEKYLDRIFKPFQRLHGRNSPYDGTGIGLAICRKIVEYHRGMITAKSIPGAGSTFIVHLPLRNNDLEELPAVPAAEKHRQNRDPALGLGVIRHPEKPL